MAKSHYQSITIKYFIFLSPAKPLPNGVFTSILVFKDLKVEPNLDALLFGESVLNDAVAIVLSEVLNE